MKIHFVFLFVFIIFLHAACRQKEKSNQSSKKDHHIVNEELKYDDYKIIIDESKGKLLESAEQFNSYLDSVVFVPLESTSKSLIGEVSRLEIVNDTIIIHDDNNDNILTFTKEGDFITKVGKKGKGPGEYSKINCFAIDYLQNHILLFDDSRKNIFRYKLNGELIEKEKSVRAYPFYVAFHNDKYIYFKNQDSYFDGESIYYNIISFDNKNKEILDKYFPFSKEDEKKVWHMPKHPFYYLNDTLHYIEKWGNRVFKITSDTIIPYLKLNFGKHELPVEYTKSESDYMSNKDDYTFLYTYMFESKKHIWFKYSKGGDLFMGLFFKKNNKLLVTKTTKSIILSFFSFSIKCTYNDAFVGDIEVNQLLPLKNPKANKIIKKHSQLRNIINNISVESNPVLAFFYLKDS